jgi:hypothetical protein
VYVLTNDLDLKLEYKVMKGERGESICYQLYLYLYEDAINETNKGEMEEEQLLIKIPNNALVPRD